MAAAWTSVRGHGQPAATASAFPSGDQASPTHRRREAEDRVRPVQSAPSEGAARIVIDTKLPSGDQEYP